MEDRQEPRQAGERPERPERPGRAPPPPPLDTVGGVWPAWGGSSAAWSGLARLGSGTSESVGMRMTHSSGGSSLLRDNMWASLTGEMGRSTNLATPSSCCGWLLSLPGKFCSFIVWLVGCICFFFSGCLLPILCGCQMLLLDYVLCTENVRLAHWVWFFVACEIGLLAHLVKNRGDMRIVGSGSFQWIVYSWLISTKSCVLYFHVLPELEDRNLTLDVRAVVSLLWLTPLFYAMLSLRTLVELYHTDGMNQDQREHGHRHDRKRDKEEHTRLDVVLLTDMVWHVVIDEIDIFYMMFFSNPSDQQFSIVDPILMTERPETVQVIRVLVGVFIFLGLFFHQQSFPSISYAASSKSIVGEGEPTTRSNQVQFDIRNTRATNNSARTLNSTTVEVSSPAGARSSDRSTISVGTSNHSTFDYRVDVVKARKRSAIVSILMVDLPFLVIRTYMYILSMNTQADQVTTTLSTTTILVQAAQESGPFLIESSPFANFIGQNQLDKFWVKNILCMLLQAMQLRFVQQADLERSQSLRWWDLRRSKADGPSLSARRRRGEQDRLLRKKWQELDRGKLEAAMHDTGGTGLTSDEEPGGEWRETVAPSVARQFFHDASGIPTGPAGPTQRETRQDTSPRRTSDSHSSPRRSCCRWCSFSCCCCRRCSRRRCCSCDCSYGIVAHILMGAVLGWLIAKVDFFQAATDLMLGLGRQQAGGVGLPRPTF